MMNRKEDLVFHVVSKRKFKENFSGGSYHPQELEEGGLLCVTVENLQEHLNKNFSKRKNLFILVIDRIRLESRVSRNEDEGLIYIEGAINQGAVIDKIRIDCNRDGLFDISIETT